MVVNLQEFTHIFIVQELIDYDLKKLFKGIPITVLEEDHIKTILYN